MPVPILRSVEAAHATALRALCNWLERDPVLQQIKVHFRVWKGDKPGDHVEPTASQLPWVRLTPAMGEIEPLCLMGDGLRSWHTPLDVTVETAVAGSLAEDSIKLDAAIFDRVMAWDCQAHGVSEVLPVMPAQTVNEGDTFTVAKGSFRMEIYVTG